MCIRDSVRRVEVLPPSHKTRLVKLVAKPVYRALGPAFRGEASAVAKLIESCDAYELRRELEERGEALLKSPEGRVYRLKREMVEFEEEWVEGLVAEEFEKGLVVLDVRMGAEERAEGLARDVLRRIQFMRKIMEMPVEAFVEVEVYAPEEIRKALEERADYIANEVRARSLRLVNRAEDVKGELVKDWEIEGYRVRIGLTRLKS